MRIRKSQTRFSSFSLSDPHLTNRLPPALVQLAVDAAPKAEEAPLSLDRCRPSDHPLLPIGKLSNGCDDPSGEGGAHRPQQRNKQEPLEEVEDVRGQLGKGDSAGEKGNHTRKGCIFGSEMMQVDSFPPPSPPSTQDGRWYDGEKTIPLKKRRGSFENNNATAASHDNKKMKTKMNKKCSSSATQNGDDVDRVGDDVSASNGKKRARGSAVMEGSRCSRVNGRGWRCCQPTLVGYSLCEHHLGKGRLRSMASVRNRSMKKEVQDLLPQPSSCGGDNSSSSSSLERKNKSGGADYPLGKSEKKAAVAVTKKRMKLGMVKARSMSSLMGQTNTQVVVADENNK